MPGRNRHDGFAPIGAYAALGDGRTVALVADDGSVDWLPIHAIDAPPSFAAMLDPAHGGRIELGPADDYAVRRRYRPDTAVLETTFETASGAVTVTDCLNQQAGHPLPWTELARVVRADRGSVRMRWRVAPGRQFGAADPWVETRNGTPLIRVGSATIAVVTGDAGQPQAGRHDVAGEFTATPGVLSVLALIGTDREPLLVPAAADVIGRVSATAEHWRNWRQGIRYDGLHPEAVSRSALTLRLLTLAAAGANAAAPTTSLPEAIGGERNFDYRFVWVRDTSFALDSLAGLGLAQEVHSTLSWLLSAVAKSAPDVHVFYTLGGDPAAAQVREIATMPGYRNSGPVRVGNPAADQRQLGAYGHLMEAVRRYVAHGGELDPATGRMLAEMADQVCDLWQEPDAGLWELGDYQHYTSSKIGCWVAADRAAWLADHGQAPAWHAARWRAAAADIQAWVEEHCWSRRKRSYTMHAGTEDLDAAVLLAARAGFCADPQRLRSTIDAIRGELTAAGPLLYRYSAVRGAEGAFAACTFWLVEALAATGQRQQAHAVFEDMLGYRNDVGLLSEEIDPDAGQLLGNFPQGLSHLALIGAAIALAAPEDHP